MAFLLTDLLSSHLQQRPEKVAVSCGNESFTYAKLAELTDKIANALIEGGLKAGDRVGIYAPKSARTVVAMLGASKAGAVYIPLDIMAPAARSQTICSDCQVSFLITTKALLSNVETIVPGCPAIHWIGFLDDECPATVSNLAATVTWWGNFSTVSIPPLSRPNIVENDLAYILYTSGSTGIPKGVMITHRNALAYIEWHANTCAVQSTDRLANYTPFLFSLSVFDIYASLMCGATVSIVPPEIASFPYQIVRWIEMERITIWYSVPSILKMMLLHGKIETANLFHLRLIMFAGEVFPPKYLRRLMEALPQAAFCNIYGTTETNVCTYYWVPRDKDLIANVPLGKACEHSDIFVMRSDNTFTSIIGEEGELCLRGATVMRGYWGNNDATAHALLLSHPENPNLIGPIYRTGDLVRIGEDGFFYLLGRRDHMVKSRGYRIELGEIESTLIAYPSIEHAVVIPLPDELIGSRLVACLMLVPDKTLDMKEIKRHCAQILPSYMVPEQFHVYSPLPLTPTGKVDRTKLHTELLTLISAKSQSL